MFRDTFENIVVQTLYNNLPTGFKYIVIIQLENYGIGVKLQCEYNPQAGNRRRNWQGDGGGETSGPTSAAAPMG